MKHKRPIILLVVLALIGSYVSVGIWWGEKYNCNHFNCVDMSYCLAPVFRHVGFDTRVVYGSNDESAHCWLSLNGLYFDATSLMFDSESGYVVDFIDSYPWGYWDELGLGGK